MADEKTAVTEIVTGLGISGASSIDSALAARPTALRGVDAATWSQVAQAWFEGRHAGLFAAAWDNGRSLFEATDGLRGRVPATIEWKGPHKPPGYESVPADLRIDHVYLVSCKYGSDISTNCSPSNLFDRLLAQRTAGSEPWYGSVAPEAYASFYEEVRAVIPGLPSSPDGLTKHDVGVIRDACQRTWPEPLLEPWRTFSFEVGAASAARWRAQLATTAICELQLWRLLRLETSPYFVLGATKAGAPVRYRVATPWDWRQAYRFRSLDVTAAAAAGQPLVRWHAVAQDRERGVDVVVEGEVEVRWSHGRFSAVEAKLHLKTPAAAVPGYFPLA